MRNFFKSNFKFALLLSCIALTLVGCNNNEAAAPGAVTVLTATASNVDKTSATVGGRYEASVGQRVEETGIEYKKADSVAYTKVMTTDPSQTPFSINLTNLKMNSKYTYRAYAKVAQSTFYGDEANFTTLDTIIVDKNYITLTQLRAKGETTITDDVYLKATVISDQVGGNSTSLKNIVISDGQAGIVVRLTANAETLPVGTEVELSLKDAILAKYQEVLQVSSFDNAKMVKTGQTNEIAPTAITSAQLLTGDYESMYVEVADVEVVAADLTKTMVVGGNTSINMESKTGEAFVMFSSSYAAYAADNVPQGSGTLKGIASVNINTSTVYQIMPRSASDYAGLTGDRFGGVAPVDNATTLASWTFTAVPVLPMVSTSASTDAASSDAVFNVFGFTNTPSFSFTASSQTIYCSGWGVNQGWSALMHPVQTIAAGKTLNVSFEAYGSNTAPRDFAVEYSSDNATWTAIGDPIVEKNSNQPFLRSVVTTQDISNNLYVRIRVTSNSSIGGTTIGTGGNSRLANLKISFE